MEVVVVVVYWGLRARIRMEAGTKNLNILPGLAQFMPAILSQRSLIILQGAAVSEILLEVRPGIGV